MEITMGQWTEMDSGGVPWALDQIAPEATPVPEHYSIMRANNSPHFLKPA